MNIFSNILNRISPKEAETRSNTVTFDGVLGALWNGKTKSGANVNYKSAMTTSAIFACINIISETIASLPLNVYQKSDKSTEINKNHKLSQLISAAPNDLQTRFVFWQTMVSNVLGTGNAYARIHRDKSYIPSYLEPLESSEVETSFDFSKNKIAYKTDGKIIKSEDMIHIQDLTFDGVNGISRITYHRETIGIGLTELDFQASFLGNGANVSGVLENPGVLNDEAYKRQAKSWRSTYEGSDNSGKTAILEGGTTYKQMGIKPIDAQFLEQRKFTVEEIARIYRVPLHLLQDLSRSTNNNIEHQSIDFVTHTIRPWVKRIEAELDRKLFTEVEKRSNNVFTRFNLDALLRGDVKSRSEFYRSLYNTSSISPNEIRQYEGLNPYDGGDEYFVQGSMQPVKNAGNEDK